MRIVCISDTHAQHRRLVLPRADVLIHAGDFTAWPRRDRTSDFFAWLEELDFTHKIVIAGNHDFICERNPFEIRAAFERAGVHYLNDSSVELDGIVYWGSPVTPRFLNLAFNRDRGVDIRRHWDRIPENCNVVITHTPPYGVGDRIPLGKRNVGCKDLLDKIEEISPALHVFGHIHEGYGCHSLPGFRTHFVNACSKKTVPFAFNPPILIEMHQEELLRPAKRVAWENSYVPVTLPR